MKPFLKHTIPIAIITLISLSINGCQKNEILKEIQEEKKQTKEASKNISSIVEKYIPKGVTEESAKKILENNGFKYHPRNNTHPNTAIGSNIDRHWTLLGLYYDETRIILHIKEGKVEEVEAWLFFDGL